MPDEPNESQPTANPPAMNPDLAGYPTPEALAKGYRESGEEAKRQRERADALEQQIQAYQAQAANPRQAIPDRSGDPSTTLQEFGVPVDALDQLLEQRFNQKFQQAFEPLQRGMEARPEVVGKYPDYQKYEADVTQYIQSDPQRNQEYQDVFRTNPAAAMKLAFLQFAEDRRGSVAPAVANGEDQANASIPQSTGSAGRSTGDALQDAVDEAWSQFQQTGSAAAKDRWMRLRIRQAVPQEHYNDVPVDQ